jgi:hypothetical protein
MFRWVRRALLVVALVVLVGGGILALIARPDLDSTRNDVESRWRVLRPALDTRYDLLAEANEQTKVAGGPQRDIVRDIDAALAKWRRDRNAPVATQVDDANNLQGLGRRLSATVTGSPRLMAENAVVLRTIRYADAEIPEQARSFNTSVRDYEDARGGSIRRPIAGLLGFDAIASYDTSPTPAPPAAQG